MGFISCFQTVSYEDKQPKHIEVNIAFKLFVSIWELNAKKNECFTFQKLSSLKCFHQVQSPAIFTNFPGIGINHLQIFWKTVENLCSKSNNYTVIPFLYCYDYSETCFRKKNVGDIYTSKNAHIKDVNLEMQPFLKFRNN